MDENYTKFPNRLLDWLIAKSPQLTKRELVVMLAVVRNTIGWHIERRTMSCRYLSAATGIAPGHISVTLKQLHQGGKGWLLVDNSGSAGVISLNIEAITADMNAAAESAPASVTESVTAGVTDSVTAGVTETVTVDTELVTASVTESVTGCYQTGNETVTDLVTKKEKERNINKETTAGSAGVPVSNKDDPFAGLF
jgi:phage replication O-like protein O